MKKILVSKWLTLVVALTLVLALTTPLGWAQEPCTVTFSDPSVTLGNNVTISVRVSGNVGAAKIQMAYDQSYLQFVGGDLGDGSGGGGVVTLYRMYNSGYGSMTFSMTFKALKTGKTTVSCAGFDIADGIQGDDMSVNMGNSVVTINAPYTASSNNNLSSLSISPGTLSPGFSAGTTSYRASVSNSTTSVAVSATAADGKAKVAVWGNTGLDVGNNTVTVQVTAENGAKKTYTITVNRAQGSTGGNTGGNTGGGTGGNTGGNIGGNTGGDTGGDDQNPQVTATPAPTPTQTPDILVTLADDTQLPVATQLPEEVTLPKGFEASQLEVEGQTIPTAVHQEGGLVAVYLEGDEEHPAGFYFFNEKTRQVQAMTPVAMSTGKLTLVDLPQDLEIPEGYSSTLMELGGQQHTLLIPDGVEEPNHYIVCALDEDGKLGLYLYDVEQQSFQRYQFLDLPQDEAPVESEEPQEDAGFVFSLFGRQAHTGWSDGAVSTLLVGLSALAVVLVVAVIVLVVCLVRSRKQLHLEWMRQEEERQWKIIAGAHTAGITVDDIVEEYANKSKAGQSLDQPPQAVSLPPAEEAEYAPEHPDQDN